jgi:hypothetical protein
MRTILSTKIGLCVVGVFAVVFAGCYTSFGDALKGKAERADELTASAADVTALKVTTNVGAIKLSPSETGEVRITAHITVKAKTDEEADELIEQVRITAEPSGDTLVIKAEKPSGFGHNQLAVDFTITAPAGLRLECTTNVGDIRIDGFNSRIKARTDVGSIDCAGLRDGIDLHTNVGDIRAAYSPDAPTALDVSAATNVGSIDFSGPVQISANLTAAANVGDIHTDRPLTVRGSLGKSIKASLGGAEGRVDLHTNVGSITIR